MGRQAGKYGPGGKVVQGCVPERILKAWKQADYNQKAAMLSLVENILLGGQSAPVQTIEKKGPGRPSTKTEGQKEQKEQYEINTLRTQRTQAKDPHMPRPNPALEEKYGHILDAEDAKIKQMLEERQKQNQKKAEVDEKQYDYSYRIYVEPYSKENVNEWIEDLAGELKQKGKNANFIMEMARVTREKMKEKYPHLYEEKQKPIETEVDEKQYDYSHLIQGEPCSKEEVNDRILQIDERLRLEEKDEQFIKQAIKVTREKAKEKFPHIYEEYTEFDFHTEENKPLNTWADEI